LLHLVGDLFELNVKLRYQKVNISYLQHLMGLNEFVLNVKMKD